MISDFAEPGCIKWCEDNGDCDAMGCEQFGHLCEGYEMALGHKGNKKEVKLVSLGSHGCGTCPGLEMLIVLGMRMSE